MSRTSPSTPSGSAYRHEYHAINGLSTTSSVPSTKYSPFYEPSPASTHGESATDSVLSTPFISGSAADNIRSSPQSLRIGSGIRSQILNIDSPAQVRKSACTGLHADSGKQYQDGVMLQEGTAMRSALGSGMSGSSPAKLAKLLESLTVQSDLAEQALRQLPGTPSSKGKTGLSNFVRGTNAEDPFTTKHVFSEANRKTSTSSPATPSRQSKSSDATPTRSGSTRASQRIISSTHSKDKSNNLPTVHEAAFSPRVDRQAEKPTSANAQAIFPPNACIFVANLASTCSDDILERAVTATFSPFGTVYVKIRRDGRGMPYAFCQYENKADADRAVVAGKNQLIHGRPCRTEIAKAQRALYVSRHNGKAVTDEDVRILLSNRGDLEKVFAPTDTEREIYQLPLGLWVRFAFFQDCRDAIAALRNNPDFRFDQVQEPTRNSAARYQPPVSVTLTPSSSGLANFPQDTPYHSDVEHSILVEGLPVNISQRELSSIFDQYGCIQASHISSHRNQNGRISVSAHIEYKQQRSVQAAIKGENGRMLGVSKLHVERRVPGYSPNDAALSPLALRSSRFSARDMYGGSPTAMPAATPGYSYPQNVNLESSREVVGDGFPTPDGNAAFLNPAYLYSHPFHQMYPPAWHHYTNYPGAPSTAGSVYGNSAEAHDGGQPYQYGQMPMASYPYGYYNYAQHQMLPTAQAFRPGVDRPIAVVQQSGSDMSGHRPHAATYAQTLYTPTPTTTSAEQTARQTVIIPSSTEPAYRS